MLGTMKNLMITLVFSTVLATNCFAQSIYKCNTHDGKIEFSQFPCSQDKGNPSLERKESLEYKKEKEASRIRAARELNRLEVKNKLVELDEKKKRLDEKAKNNAEARASIRVLENPYSSNEEKLDAVNKIRGSMTGVGVVRDSSRRVSDYELMRELDSAISDLSK